MNLLEKPWFQKLALHITTAGALMVLYVAYLLLWPVTPMQVIQPYKVLTPVVSQGTRMAYEVAYCTKKPRTFVVHRVLLNVKTQELWDIPDRINILSKGCTKETHELLTPLRADLGKYKMIATVTLQVNPIRSVTYQYETEVFEITEPMSTINGVIK